MKLREILFRTGKADARAANVRESRLWTRAGLEPSTTELLSDPITILLMRADKLQASQVESLIREARERTARRARRGTAPMDVAAILDVAKTAPQRQPANAAGWLDA